MLFNFFFKKRTAPAKNCSKTQCNENNNYTTKLTDWKYDFSSLPHWDRHNSAYTYDNFIELKKTDTLCCLYSIVEARMMYCIGDLAILKNKQEPKLYLNITDIAFKPQVFYNKNENLLFLLADMYKKDYKTDKYKYNLMATVIIIDVTKDVFSYYKTDNIYSPNKIVELDDDIFEMQVDDYQMKNNETIKPLNGKQIKISELKWYDFSEFNSLSEMIFQ